MLRVHYCAPLAGEETEAQMSNWSQVTQLWEQHPIAAVACLAFFGELFVVTALPCVP